MSQVEAVDIYFGPDPVRALARSQRSSREDATDGAGCTKRDMKSWLAPGHTLGF